MQNCLEGIVDSYLLNLNPQILILIAPDRGHHILGPFMTWKYKEKEK